MTQEGLSFLPTAIRGSVPEDKINLVGSDEVSYEEYVTTPPRAGEYLVFVEGMFGLSINSWLRRKQAPSKIVSRKEGRLESLLEGVLEKCVKLFPSFEED